MKNKYLIAGILLSASNSVLSAPYTTFGGTDCGKWITVTTSARQAWLLGFLSGLAFLHARKDFKPVNPLDSVSSAEQMFVWMDNYCKTNPLGNVTEGAVELFDEIVDRKR